MVIVIKAKCIKISSMAWVLSPILRLLKKVSSDMGNLSLESSLSMMELFIKAPYKMDKNLAKEPSKEKTDFITLDTSSTINLTEMAKFSTPTNPATKEPFAKALKVVKDVSLG